MPQKRVMQPFQKQNIQQKSIKQQSTEILKSEAKNTKEQKKW